MKKLVFGVILGLVAYGTLEGISLVAIWLIEPYLDEEIRRTRDIYREQSEKIQHLLQDDAARRDVRDSILGWRYRPGYWDAENTVNSQGLRSKRDYALVPPAGVLRVAAFGDSFVYGTEVRDEHAWPRLMETMSPNLEVLNYGVGGYGTDHALLRYRLEGDVLSPHVVLIGFASVDLRRVVNVYRRFIWSREIVVTKPRFVMTTDGDLVLVPNPVPRVSDFRKYLDDPAAIVTLGQHDYWYTPWVYANPFYDFSATVRLLSTAWVRVARRYVYKDRLFRGSVFNPESEAFKIQLALFEQFARDVEASGAEPIVVILPARESVIRARNGSEPMSQPLADRLATMQIDYVNLVEAFVAADETESVNAWFMSGGHYSEAGNKIVASWLRDYLVPKG